MSILPSDVEISTSYYVLQVSLSSGMSNLLKNMNIGIAFKTTTLHPLIKPIAPTQLQEHEKSGIYEITCKNCHKAFVG